MNRNFFYWQAMLLILIALIAGIDAPALAAHKQTFTGEVGDAMCGNKHMEGTPAECTRACVSKGSKYALVVGDKVYVLNATNPADLATLDKQAGNRVSVTGTLNGETIDVSSVAAK
jgi:hypothetical protein